MRMLTTRISALAVALLGTGCATGASGDPPAPLIVISIDGFWYDYRDRVPTPALDRLAKNGVEAPLVPAFPTKTFPNHYTIVTGLYPDQHGIVANNMYDAAMDAWFSLSDRAAVEDPRWWGGEPIWVTARRQGLVAGAYFWPGTEAPVGGAHPRYWKRFDERVPDDARIDSLLAWLDLPARIRPGLLLTYFELVDVAGHTFGPFSPEVDSAVAEVDRVIGRLLRGLDERGTAANVVVVSDHGMAATARDRWIYLDDYVDPDTLQVIDWTPVLQIRPADGGADDLRAALAGRHPHLHVFRKAALPARWHYGTNPRVQEIVAVADVGWQIGTRQYMDAHPEAYGAGQHGYDNEAPSMRGLFVAAGPGFRSGVSAAPFQNIHLYELMARLLALEPAPNAGDPDSTAAFLRSSPGATR